MAGFIDQSHQKILDKAMFSTTAMKIVKNEHVHTYVIMPLSKSAYTVFDRDTLLDSFNAEPREDDPEMTDYDAVVARINGKKGGFDWEWFFEEPDKEKPFEFSGSLKGCLKDIVQRLDLENGQSNRYTVVARMYNMMAPEQMRDVVSAAEAYPAADFLAKQGIELETASQRFISENIENNWRPSDFSLVYFLADDSKSDPERPVDHAAENGKAAEVATRLAQTLNLRCWRIAVEPGYFDGVQLVVRNVKSLPEFNESGDAKTAVVKLFGDRYSSVCRALASIANENEEDIMKELRLSPVKINSVFSLMGFAKSYQNGKYVGIPADREADEIALDEIDEYEDHFYEVIWDCLAAREANVIMAEVVNPLVATYGWKVDRGESEEVNELNEGASEVNPATVQSLASANTDRPATAASNRLLFGGEGDNRNWTKLKWQSAMGVGQRTAKSIAISERMFGSNELNYLIKDGMDPYKFNETRTQWRSHPLAAIAYDMDFAAQYVNDYMDKAGVRPGDVEGGEFGTLMFTSTFTNGSRLFADDQGRVFLNLAFGEEDEYPEDIATNSATLLSWCTGVFSPQSNPKASEFYTTLRNYLQEAVKRWADVCASIKMAGATEDAVLERFTVLMESFPERKSDVNVIVSKFNNYIFKAYNPMENLNKCIENLSKGNVTVV